eukprot:TRINITY_DN67541_c0_g1_i3.p1 TRINITY_DN67541_c0_g1~~TRINITY_DN67541_c0_g1_i3.p1  ORF type:complete len:925 (-),score=132.30 TRINITY_DN67541_c0_g1_i3:206-2956(-)
MPMSWVLALLCVGSVYAALAPPKMDMCASSGYWCEWTNSYVKDCCTECGQLQASAVDDHNSCYCKASWDIFDILAKERQNQHNEFGDYVDLFETAFYPDHANLLPRCDVTVLITEDVSSILKSATTPQYQEYLRTVILYNTLPGGMRMAMDLGKEGTVATMAEGRYVEFMIKATPNGPEVFALGTGYDLVSGWNIAKVLSADNWLDVGTYHVMSGLLYPPGPRKVEIPTLQWEQPKFKTVYDQPMELCIATGCVKEGEVCNLPAQGTLFTVPDPTNCAGSRTSRSQSAGTIGVCQPAVTTVLDPFLAITSPDFYLTYYHKNAGMAVLVDPVNGVGYVADFAVAGPREPDQTFTISFPETTAAFSNGVPIGDNMYYVSEVLGQGWKLGRLTLTSNIDTWTARSGTGAEPQLVVAGEYHRLHEPLCDIECANTFDVCYSKDPMPAPSCGGCGPPFNYHKCGSGAICRSDYRCDYSTSASPDDLTEYNGSPIVCGPAVDEPELNILGHHGSAPSAAERITANDKANTAVFDSSPFSPGYYGTPQLNRWGMDDATSTILMFGGNDNTAGDALSNDLVEIDVSECVTVLSASNDDEQSWRRWPKGEVLRVGFVTGANAAVPRVRILLSGATDGIPSPTSDDAATDLVLQSHTTSISTAYYFECDGNSIRYGTKYPLEDRLFFDEDDFPEGPQFFRFVQPTGGNFADPTFVRILDKNAAACPLVTPEISERRAIAFPICRAGSCGTPASGTDGDTRSTTMIGNTLYFTAPFSAILDTDVKLWKIDLDAQMPRYEAVCTFPATTDCTSRPTNCGSVGFPFPLTMVVPKPALLGNNYNGKLYWFNYQTPMVLGLLVVDPNEEAQDSRLEMIMLTVPEPVSQAISSSVPQAFASSASWVDEEKGVVMFEYMSGWVGRIQIPKAYM